MNNARWTVTDIPPQTGKLAVVTGANSGIGWHTALELARAGSEVILAARSEAKGRDAGSRCWYKFPSQREMKRLPALYGRFRGS
jgi:NAD(P)-dependent dehydrogenase (short-subunit alcohol dehydrogenase family)